MMVDDGRCAVVAALMIREARRTVKHSSHMHVWWAFAPVLTGFREKRSCARYVQICAMRWHNICLFKILSYC